MTFHTDYESEPIGGGNPYHRCIHCHQSAPAINGRLEGHLSSCEYRQAKEAGFTYKPFDDNCDVGATQADEGDDES